MMKALKAEAKKLGASTAEIVRLAVSEYLKNQ
jgi:hypothetical protein